MAKDREGLFLVYADTTSPIPAQRAAEAARDLHNTNFPCDLVSATHITKYPDELDGWPAVGTFGDRYTFYQMAETTGLHPDTPSLIAMPANVDGISRTLNGPIDHSQLLDRVIDTITEGDNPLIKRSLPAGRFYTDGESGEFYGNITPDNDNLIPIINGLVEGHGPKRRRIKDLYKLINKLKDRDVQPLAVTIFDRSGQCEEFIAANAAIVKGMPRYKPRSHNTSDSDYDYLITIGRRREDFGSRNLTCATVAGIAKAMREGDIPLYDSLEDGVVLSKIPLRPDQQIIFTALERKINGFVADGKFHPIANREMKVKPRISTPIVTVYSAR